MIFLKKNHGNMIFPPNVLERWLFQKKNSLEYGPSCFIRKNGISFTQKNMISFFQCKMKDDLLKKISWKISLKKHLPQLEQ